MDLKAEFARRGPWITRFVVEGVESGGAFDPQADPRLSQFFASFPGVRSILDLGSLEGGQTFLLAQHSGVERVVGIEARASSIGRARFVQGLLAISNVEFLEADLEKTDLVSFGPFDAVFCSGLLYHLPEPWKLIRQISRITSNLFLWTHYADDLKADVIEQEFRGHYHVEGGIDEPLSGTSAKSFWLTLGSMAKALNESGFRTIRILGNELKHPNGPAITLAATTV